MPLFVLAEPNCASVSSAFSEMVDIPFPFDFAAKVEKLTLAFGRGESAESLIHDLGLGPARRDFHGCFERVIVEVERRSHASALRAYGKRGSCDRLSLPKCVPCNALSLLCCS